MRDEALHLLQEHKGRHRTMRVRAAEVDEEGYRVEQAQIIPTRGQYMSTPSHMMQAHHQFQAQLMQLSYQHNEMANQLPAVRTNFCKGMFPDR